MNRPQCRKVSTCWNFSFVLHQLTKPPFEPPKSASLKHFQNSFFFLVLGSGKHRREIHAWLKKSKHQIGLFQVSFYPSPSFLSKNQLASLDLRV